MEKSFTPEVGMLQPSTLYQSIDLLFLYSVTLSECLKGDYLRSYLRKTTGNLWIFGSSVSGVEACRKCAGVCRKHLGSIVRALEGPRSLIRGANFTKRFI
jgi:hypothetical protein